jgi:hypothetical protein
MEVAMIRFTLVIVLIYCLVSSSLTQSSSVQAEQCRVKELLNYQGWEIPGLAAATVKLHARYKSEGVPDNVFIDLMESQAPLVRLTFVGLKSCETAVISFRSIEVNRIERFIMNGHVFGYRVTGTIASVDNQGHRTLAGSDEIVYYYDPDGSGKFSVMRYDSSELTFKIIIPDWVK